MKFGQILLQAMNRPRYQFFVSMVAVLGSPDGDPVHHPRIQGTKNCVTSKHADSYRGPVSQRGYIHGTGFSLFVDKRVHLRSEIVSVDGESLVVIDYAWASNSALTRSYFALRLSPVEEGAGPAVPVGTSGEDIASYVLELNEEEVLQARTGWSLDVDVAGVDRATGALVVCERDAARMGSTSRWGRLRTRAEVAHHVVETPTTGRGVVEFTHASGVFHCRPSVYIHWSAVSEGTIYVNAARSYLVSTPCRHVPRIGARVLTTHLLKAWLLQKESSSGGTL